MVKWPRMNRKMPKKRNKYHEYIRIKVPWYFYHSHDAIHIFNINLSRINKVESENR